MYDVSEVLIGGIDVVSEHGLWQRLGDGSHGLTKIKLDRATLTELGLGVVDTLLEEGYECFVDAKLIEVPNRMAELTKIHLDHQPWMLNCMAGIVSTGELDPEDRKKLDALKRFADDCLAAGTLPCAVTVLTSKTKDVIAREFGGRSNMEQVLEYVEMLYGAGFTDIVCSPQECVAIRSDSRFDGMSINTPGVRLPGSDQGTQARTDTPLASLQNGATRVVAVSDLVPAEGETLGDRVEVFRDHLITPSLPDEFLRPARQAPMCFQCGVTMIRAGAFHACPSCGSTAEGN